MSARELLLLRDKMPEEHKEMWNLYTGERWLSPDLVISPDGKPYLYRWYLTGVRGKAGQIFHIQARSDPERPLHDHPWDNMSVILAGGYTEHIQEEPPGGLTLIYRRVEGDTIYRRATAAHRLELPKGVRYAMTLFSFGPATREWGFWYPDGWHSHTQHVEVSADGTSIHVNRDA